MENPEHDQARFGFGRNWQEFARNLTEQQMMAAEASLQKMLGLDSLDGLRFLDAGCGSGLFSLAACRLKATEVVSFDYDADSVDCTRRLKDRFGPFPNWAIIRGDALDREFLASLGKFDIVYSWGVLHHTGDMWRALDYITGPVKPGGHLFLSLYNDQGLISRVWRAIKRLYVKSPVPIEALIASGWYTITIVYRVLRGIRRRQPPSKWLRGSERGMSLWHDVVDWVGGYPFETAKPESVIDFFSTRGFQTQKLARRSGSGCNEFVLRRSVATSTNA